MSDDSIVENDLLTDEMLAEFGALALEAGDVVMAMRCDHALTDPIARRDVAIEIMRRGAVES